MLAYLKLCFTLTLISCIFISISNAINFDISPEKTKISAKSNKPQLNKYDQYRQRQPMNKTKKYNRFQFGSNEQPSTNTSNMHPNTIHNQTLPTTDISKLLNSKRIQFSQMSSKSIPIYDLPQELWNYVQLSFSEQYDGKYVLPDKHFFDNLIDIKNIEFIFNEDDKVLTHQILSELPKKFMKSLKISTRYSKFMQELEKHSKKSSSSSSSEPFEIKNEQKNEQKNEKKYGQKNEQKNERKNGQPKNRNEDDRQLLSRSIYDIEPFNFNGATSDIARSANYHKHKNTESTGISGEYWSVSKTCVQLKGCNVYSAMRVIHHSTDIQCQEILNLLMTQIYDCVDKYGIADCPLFIKHGYFRYVFKVKMGRKWVVLKIMRPKTNEKPRDLLRHIRESIMLYYLRHEELQYLEKYGSSMMSNGEKRAFPFVRELGHCLYPTFMSVSQYYNLTLDHFIDKGFAMRSSLEQLMIMSVDIARSVELLHNMKGGPFSHTDIEPAQFMIDENGRVFINDFNRGKFASFFFADDYNSNVEGDNYMRDHRMDEHLNKKCWYCPHHSSGNYRAPEEQVSAPLDEKLDVFSAALVIWTLFAGTEPFGKVKNSDLPYLYSDTWRRPTMPSNMPFAMKHIIRWALSQNPRDRPTAKKFRVDLEYVLKYLDQFSRGRSGKSSISLLRERYFRDSNHPKIPKELRGHSTSSS